MHTRRRFLQASLAIPVLASLPRHHVDSICIIDNNGTRFVAPLGPRGYYHIQLQPGDQWPSLPYSFATTNDQQKADSKGFLISQDIHHFHSRKDGIGLTNVAIDWLS